MAYRNRQSEEIILRYMVEKGEKYDTSADDLQFSLPKPEYAALQNRYWSLLAHWIDQLHEARDRGIPQYTIAFDRGDPILKFVLEAACHHIGWNQWYYTLMVTGDKSGTEDYDINTKMVTRLAELTVYFH